ncbi:hypothetical protein E2320_020736, partial [Naja naja]
CNYKGRKVINGHQFVPEDEPCVYCTCQLGEVSCERKICPKNDLASLENRLANPVLEDGAAKTPLQTLQRGPMALMSDSSTPNIASLTPEDHLEARARPIWLFARSKTQ